MATNMKRFTISITPEMDATLAQLKKEVYYDRTRSEMIRDIIMRGLAATTDQKASDLEKTK